MNPSFFDFNLFRVSESAAWSTRIIGVGKKGVLAVWTATADRDEEEAFLKSILQAAKIDIPQDAYSLELSENDHLSLTDLQTDQSIEYVLSFGKEPKSLGIHLNISPYQPIRYNNCWYLFVESLSAIQTDRKVAKGQKATQLWRALQAIFTDL